MTEDIKLKPSPPSRAAHLSGGFVCIACMLIILACTIVAAGGYKRGLSMLLIIQMLAWRQTWKSTKAAYEPPNIPDQRRSPL